MSRQHDRARFGAVRTALYLSRSLVAMTREPMHTPRHARRDSTRSTR